MADQHSSSWDRLGEFVTGYMARKQIPGAAVGIVHGDQTAAAGFGVTNVDHPLPVTSTTLFQIGSITKTFVGTAIMRLVERGELDLDATVRTYLPGFQVADEEAAARATVRHLLTHTSGWAGDFFHGTGSGDDALARYVADMANLPQVAPLGAHWSYNNAGFTVAGRILELVTGERFETVLGKLVLAPLGLKQAFLDPGDVMTHRFASGHEDGDDGPEVARPWPLGRSAVPMGGLACHVEDLLRYARFHLGDGRAKDGTRLLTPESLALMQSPHVKRWRTEAWGLPWGIIEVNGLRQVSHSGGTKGQISLLALVPERDFALVVLTNADSGGSLTEEVRRWALREYLGLEVPRLEAIDAPEEELAQFAGHWHGFFNDLDLAMLGGRLAGQVTYTRGFPSEDVPPSPQPPPMSLALCEKDRLLVLDGPDKGDWCDGIRREDGTIGWLRFGGRLHVRGE